MNREKVCPSCGFDQDGGNPTHCLSCGWPLKASERATSEIQLRVSRSRKAAYVRAAQPGTLAAWCFKWLDKASGFRPEERKL